MTGVEYFRFGEHFRVLERKRFADPVRNRLRAAARPYSDLLILVPVFQENQLFNPEFRS
jgi:hypothetical protein